MHKAIKNRRNFAESNHYRVMNYATRILARVNSSGAVVAGIVFISLGVRLLYLPSAAIEDADSVTRLWEGWRWASHPKIYISGVWGPLHFYLIGIVIKIFPASALAPIVLHVGFSVATILAIYAFTTFEFRSSRAAILAALMWALYPLAIRLSIDIRSETISAFFIGLCMVFIALARNQTPSWPYAIAAGVCLTSAAALRYEAWMLIPFFGLLLIKKPKDLVLFFFSSMLHPTVWMIGNFLELGDPFYSFNWASNFELNLMGNALEDLTWIQRVSRVLNFFYSWANGITPLAALVCIFGVVIAIIKKHRATIWLIPLIGLASLYAFAIAGGSLLTKMSYTLVFGLFLVPFSAAFFQGVGIDRISLKKFFEVITTCGLLMLAFSFPTESRSRLLSNPIPSFENVENVRRLASTMRQAIEPDDGLIIDFFGWEETYYLGLLSGLYPDRIFVPPGALYETLSEEAFMEFANQYPKGVLVLHNESRFAEYLLRFNEDENQRMRLGLKEIDRRVWHGFEDWEGAIRGAQVVAEPQVHLYRYTFDIKSRPTYRQSSHKANTVSGSR